MSEELLSGGNTSVVLRVGDTVRRPTGHWTPAVHALLRHLHGVGFEGAPTVLGVDEEDREVLSFVEGAVGSLGARRLPTAFQTLKACHAVGGWLRRFHEAQAGFLPDPALPWRMVPGRELAPGEVVVHHDVGPYNTIRRPDGRLSVIDFDFCAPGNPLEDLAFTLWSWVPLWAAREAVEREFGDASLTVARRKFVAVLEGYAVTPVQRERLADVVVGMMAQHAADVETLALEDPPFARLAASGVPGRARADAAWFAEHQSLFLADLA